jgi:hypothetical protein
LIWAYGDAFLRPFLPETGGIPAHAVFVCPEENLEKENALDMILSPTSYTNRRLRDVGLSDRHSKKFRRQGKPPLKFPKSPPTKGGSTGDGQGKGNGCAHQTNPAAPLEGAPLVGAA